MSGYSPAGCGELKPGLILFGLGLVCAGQVLAGPSKAPAGQVLDVNGMPVPQAMVTITPSAGNEGPSGISVFADQTGRFAFPASPGQTPWDGSEIVVKAPGYESLRKTADGSGGDVVLVVRPSANQAGSAPASAWLREIPDTDAKAVLITSCVTCHQFPTPEVRDFATSLTDVQVGDPDKVREMGWHAISKFMRFKLAKMLGRGFPEEPPYAFATDPTHFLPTREDEAVLVEVLKNHLPRRFDVLEGYDYGAPLAVTEHTLIREYAVPEPNSIRDAILMGEPKQLWVVDYDGDRLIRIDPESGAQREYPIPFEGASGPHTQVRGQDGALWLAMLFNGLVGRLDLETEKWQLWRLERPGGPEGEGLGVVYMHDMAIDEKAELGPDARGRIWVTDTANNALAAFDTATGETSAYSAPKIPGRSALATLMYGLIMSSDRRHLWYSQLWGNFGSFDTETLKYETVVELPVGAGPRRPAMTEEDILYMPLFGSGQIVEYDTRAGKQLGVYDLPDRASGPYAAAWDPKRQVVWVATSNADLIYRFDPGSKTFGVIPLPRKKTFLRMLYVDPDSGALVTTAGNLPWTAEGPRTALIINLGDGKQAYERSARR